MGEQALVLSSAEGHVAAAVPNVGNWQPLACTSFAASQGAPCFGEHEEEEGTADEGAWLELQQKLPLCWQPAWQELPAQHVHSSRSKFLDGMGYVLTLRGRNG